MLFQVELAFIGDIIVGILGDTVEKGGRRALLHRQKAVQVLHAGKLLEMGRGGAAAAVPDAKEHEGLVADPAVQIVGVYLMYAAGGRRAVVSIRTFVPSMPSQLKV